MILRAVTAKIILFCLVLNFVSCNPTKRVKEDERLLTENSIFVNNEKSKDNDLYNQLYQKPNSKLPVLGIPLKLHIYNLAKPNPDSSYTAWLNRKPNRKKRLASIYSQKQVDRIKRGYLSFHNTLKESGEPPSVYDENKSVKSKNRLEAYFWNRGWFNAEADFKSVNHKKDRTRVKYWVTTNKAYVLDSIQKQIKSPVADSLYMLSKKESILKAGQQFNTDNFEAERDRITFFFRNRGLYHFEKEFISFEADTLDTNHKVKTDIIISNREVTREDSTKTVPYKIHRISQVNIFPDYSFKSGNFAQDSAQYKGYTIYSFGKLKYKPKTLANAVFIRKGDVYKDLDRSLTYRRLNELGQFRYPDIKYQPDPRDSTGTQLIANVFLTPRPKLGVDFNVDASRSNIQDFGIGFGGSLLIRNVFGGAENLEIAARGSVGSSKEAADANDRFFNISEIGSDASLTFPSIAFPVNTEKIIPKKMSPFTTLRVGLSTQKNIGLDKQNVTGSFFYRWYPNETLSHKFSLIDLQYVKNLNTSNYFNVYTNSFSRLNEIAQDNISQINPAYFNNNSSGSGLPNLIIPEGANGFIRDLRNNQINLTREQEQIARDIIERRQRLTEDNLILATNFSYNKNTREGIYDWDFSQFRFKLETAGNSLALLGKMLNLKENSQGNYDLFGVQFSQYIKLETDFIKHWDLGKDNIIAARIMGGIALPYGNASSIPFARSFFAGGTNDNRGWQAYSLGPGSSGGINEFNEANMKIAFNLEYRFNLFGDLHSAVFTDIGNIWNVEDNVKDEASRFTKLEDLTELAVSTGFGLRYDLDFFVIRLDLGFKTYNPAQTKQKWFQEYNFANVVYNVGINYPF